MKAENWGLTLKGTFKNIFPILQEMMSRISSVFGYDREP